jgi:predicted dehydrogenase
VAMFSKVIRYTMMYGMTRTMTKILFKSDNDASRFLLSLLFNVFSVKKERIFILGLGNHGFTLIAYYVCVFARRKISCVIDPSDKSKKLAENVLKCDWFASVDCAKKAGLFYGDIVYIASDHMSHTGQALEAANQFAKVYVEKPLFVNDVQKEEFRKVCNSDCAVFTGFNRPYAPAFNSMLEVLGGEYSLTMLVNGHFLPADHWYRNDGQGSRVLGNLTHWIDLAIRVLACKNPLEEVQVEVSKGHMDDLLVLLFAGGSKLILIFSANCEPLDGVEEYIFWNSTKSVGSILNFREISYVTDKKCKVRTKSKAKNVGHKDAVLAPFTENNVSVKIPFASSSLALRIESMVINNLKTSSFKLDL